MKKEKQKINYFKLSYRWHRRIGVSIALPILVIAITGMVLNHSRFFNLEKTYVTNKAILNWYGMTPRKPALSISLNEERWISGLDGLLFVNKNLVADEATKPTGGGVINKTLAISTEDAVYLLREKSNKLIEKLGNESLPPGKIVASKVKNKKFLLDTTSGQFYTDANFGEFIPENRNPLSSVTYSELPTDIHSKILENWRGRGLSLWRVILDIHDGAFFGKIGSLLADISAIALILLVLSGFYNWRKRPTK